MNWIAKLVSAFRRKTKPVERVERPVRELVVTDHGLVPVHSEHEGGEPLLTRQQAEEFLDSISFDWRRHDEVLPGIKVGDEWLYSEAELIAWLEGDFDVRRDPESGEPMTAL